MNALGRGQDRESLAAFMTTVAQTLGPEALMRYINPSEVIKRLAAAQGIDVLNLVKTEQQLVEEQQRAQPDQIGQSLVDQAGQIARAPIAEQAMGMNQQTETPPNE